MKRKRKTSGMTKKKKKKRRRRRRERRDVSLLCDEWEDQNMTCIQKRL